MCYRYLAVITRRTYFQEYNAPSPPNTEPLLSSELFVSANPALRIVSLRLLLLLLFGGIGGEGGNEREGERKKEKEEEGYN